MRAVQFLLPAALLAAPLSAQGFEGTVTMNLPAAGTAISEMKYFVKGNQMAATATLGAAGGPMAGAEMRMIFDYKNGKLTTLIPLSADMAARFGGGSIKGIKQVSDITDMMGQGGESKAEFKAKGTSQTIAGHKCDDYQITDNGKVTNVCMASDMGNFIFGSGGGMGGRRGGGNGTPSWASLLAKHPGFPLKVWNADGAVQLEVTKIEKGPVASTMFEIPEGYMDPAGMFGGRGGGGN